VARNLEELKRQIERQAETKIRDWGTEAGIDPDSILRAIRARFGNDQSKSEVEERKARGRTDLVDLRFIVASYGPPAVVIELEEGSPLSRLPDSPPEDAAVVKLRRIAAVLREYAPETISFDDYGGSELGEDGDDDDQGEDDGDEGPASTFRTQIIALFGEVAPGITGRPTNGHLAYLSLWLSSSHGCDERRSGLSKWGDIFRAERHAMAIARERYKGG